MSFSVCSLNTNKKTRFLNHRAIFYTGIVTRVRRTLFLCVKRMGVCNKNRPFFGDFGTGHEMRYETRAGLPCVSDWVSVPM